MDKKIARRLEAEIPHTYDGNLQKIAARVGLLSAGPTPTSPHLHDMDYGAEGFGRDLAEFLTSSARQVT